MQNRKGGHPAPNMIHFKDIQPEILPIHTLAALFSDEQMSANLLLPNDLAPARASGPRESHPQALPEPYVKLSLHTAPLSQPQTSEQKDVAVFA